MWFDLNCFEIEGWWKLTSLSITFARVRRVNFFWSLAITKKSQTKEDVIRHWSNTSPGLKIILDGAQDIVICCHLIKSLVKGGVSTSPSLSNLAVIRAYRPDTLPIINFGSKALADQHREIKADTTARYHVQHLFTSRARTFCRHIKKTFSHASLSYLQNHKSNRENCTEKPFSLRRCYITKFYLAPQIDAHANDSSDGSVHALGVASAGEDGDAMSLATASGNELLNFFGHLEQTWALSVHNRNRE